MAPRLSLLLSCLVFTAGCKGADGQATTGDAGQDGASAGENIGLVGAHQLYPGTGSKPFVSVWAFFVAQAPASSCESRILGECRLVACPKAEPDGGIAPLPHRSHAGGITLQPVGPPVALVPGPDGEYPSKVQDTPLWKPGDTVTVMAAGGPVPAFTGSLRAPEDIAVTEPAPPKPAISVTIPRDADLALAWTGGTRGEVTFSLSPDDPAQIVTLTCTYPTTAGHATIGKEVLALLPAGRGLIAASVETSQDLSRGGWKLTYRLTGSAQSPVSALGFPLPALFE
jgi:hypothetical protein